MSKINLDRPARAAASPEKKGIPKIALFGAGAAILLLVLMFFWSSILENVDSREYHVKQAFGTGTLTVHGEPGIYFKNFGDIEKYPRTLTFYFSKEQLDGGDGAEAAPLKATFMGNATADVSGMIKIILPSTEEKRILLHRDYGNVEGLMMDLLRNTVASALKQTGPMFRPEEAFTTRRPEFTQIMSDILTKGIPATETMYDTISSGDKKIILTKSVLKRDSLGQSIIVSVSPLEKYGITITQFDIKDFDFDKATSQLIEKKKVAEQEIVAAKADAEKAKQRALTEIEDGKARIAKAEADALVAKKTAVVNAEKEAAVAKQKKLEADEKAAAMLSIKRAEAEAARLKVAAGLTPQERAEYEMKTAIGVAEALAGIKLPELMVTGGGNNGSVINPFDAVGLESFHRITKRMSEGK
jgi:regulator of protease activity HflC (stomatin/prohibitin superfamily)